MKCTNFVIERRGCAEGGGTNTPPDTNNLDKAPSRTAYWLWWPVSNYRTIDSVAPTAGLVSVNS